MKLHVVFSAAAVVLVGSLVGCSKPKPPSPEATDTAPATTPASTETTPPPPAETATPASPSMDFSTSTVYFDYDSWSVRSDAQDTLRKMAADLKGKTGARVQIEGHCDERGSNEYNLALGARRAKAVQEFLISEGVSAGELETISYGEERPAVQGASEDAWAKNRRGEFKSL